MNITYGAGKTTYGPGVQIDLPGDEVAMAIYTYLTAHRMRITGAAIIRVNDELIDRCSIYVDPSGSVMSNGKKWTGCGPLTKGTVMVGDLPDLRTENQ